MPLSNQTAEVIRNEIPAFAASDIWARAVVALGSQGDWAVFMPASTNLQPLGIARDYAAAGPSGAAYVTTNPVSVFDIGSIVRVPAGGSVTQGQPVGVVGASSGTHPISGVNVTYPVLGAVAHTASINTYAVGDALEQANPGETFAIRINPRLLVGLTA